MNREREWERYDPLMNRKSAQRGIADWLNANTPPARAEQWQWCICIRASGCDFPVHVFVFASVCQCLQEHWVSSWVRLIKLTCGRQHNGHNVLLNVPQFQVCRLLLIRTDVTRLMFPMQIKLRLFEAFCCQITSLNNPVAPLFSLNSPDFFLPPLFGSVPLFSASLSIVS